MSLDFTSNSTPKLGVSKVQSTALVRSEIRSANVSVSTPVLLSNI